MFCQKRVGEDGKEFMMYKFRSMTIDAEDQIDALVAALMWFLNRF